MLRRHPGGALSARIRLPAALEDAENAKHRELCELHLGHRVVAQAAPQLHAPPTRR
jgi:hypothetical protein